MQKVHCERAVLTAFALALTGSCWSCGNGRTLRPTMQSAPAPKESVVRPDHKHQAAVLQIQESPAVMKPPPADVSRIVQDELNRLPPGQIAFNPPNSMKEDATKRVEVRIARAAVPNVGGELPGNVQTAPIRVSTVMSVQLQGDTFHVTPLDPQDQIVSVDGFTQWDFDVTPTSSGDQPLSLTASVEIVVPGMGSQRRAFPVLTRTIHVQVNPVSFIKDNWQWFAGTIFIPLVVFVWQWLWKRRSDASGSSLGAHRAQPTGLRLPRLPRRYR